MLWPISRAESPETCDEIACLVCQAVRLAEPSAMIDATVALSLSAETTLGGKVSAPCLDRVVSRVLTLTEAEALDLLAAVPPQARLRDVPCEDCKLAPGCVFRRMLIDQILSP